MHEDDERSLAIVLHDERFDHGVLIGPGLVGERPRPAVFDVAIGVLGEGDALFAEEADGRRRRRFTTGSRISFA
jgi:hypothetical protein